MHRFQSFSARPIEALEPRLLLAHDASDVPGLDDFVAGSAQDVRLGRNVLVRGGLISAGDALTIGELSAVRGIEVGGAVRIGPGIAVHGDVAANHAVRVGRGSDVTGDVHSNAVALRDNASIAGNVTSGGRVILAPGSSVLGTMAEFADPRRVESPEVPEPTQFTTDSSRDIAIATDRALVLPPGPYGDMKLSKRSTLRISTGTYSFDGIYADGRASLNLDASSGPIEILVRGPVVLGKRFAGTMLGGVVEDVYLETHGDFALRQLGRWFGTVFAPNGSITLGIGTSFVGAAYGELNVKVRRGSVLDHAPAHRLHQPSDQSVPTPSITGIDSDTGVSSRDGVTNDMAPRVFGTALPNHQVQLLLDGTSQGTVLTDPSNGAWSLDLPRQPDGQYTLTAVQINPNAPGGPSTSTPSSAFPITIDTGAPALAWSLDMSSDGGFTGDETTSAQAVAISGSTQPATSVSVRRSQDPAMPTATSDGSGGFQFGGLPLELGDNAFTVTVTDVAGNQTAVHHTITRLPCDTIDLAEFTVAEADAPATRQPFSRYIPSSVDFVGDRRPLVPADGGRVGVAIALLDEDLATDVVGVSPATNELLVFLDTPSGLLGPALRYASGGIGPVSIAVGRFIGGPPLDIAVGHLDGTISFLEGVGDGTFVARPELQVAGLGPIVDLTHADFDGDGDDDLATSSTQVTTLLNGDDVLSTSPLVNGGFTTSLVGWTAEAVGHDRGLAGSVTSAGGAARLQENQSFLTSLSQTFTVPPAARTLEFDLVSLLLDDPAGGVPDAFEVSLLDQFGNPLVPAFNATATAFFNANPGSVVAAAPGVTFDGVHATLDLSSVAPGTQATLFFDLIGNQPGTGSSAVIDNVRVTPDMLPVDTFASATLDGTFPNSVGVSYCDSDADHDLDLLVRNPATGELVVYRNDGSGSFTRDAGGAGARAVAAAKSGALSYVKFYVADGASTFAYGPDGAARGSFSVNTAQDLRGLANSQDGRRLWAIDAAHRVFVHDRDLGHVGNWTALELNDPEGIATDDVDIWIVDASSDRVWRYAGASAADAGSLMPDDAFALSAQNGSPTGITTDGEVFWVVDDVSDAVFIYNSAGTPLGQWSLDPRNQDASGIALGGRDLWVVDRVDRAMYRYAGAAGVRSGMVQSGGTYALAELNAAPEGIADPPIEIGQVVNDSIDSAGEVDEFTFEYSFGSLLFDAQMGSSATFDWMLSDPTGGTVFSESFTDQGPLFLEIPATYQVTVQGHAGGTGAYQFQIHEVQFILVGDLVVDQLASPGDQRNWVFDVPADQPLFIDFQSLTGGPLFIELWAPDGTLLLSDSGNAAGELDNGLFTLADAGLYRLNTKGDGTNTPDYQFQLLDEPPVPPDVRMMNIGEVAMGAIEVLGAVDVWEFNAAAGQSVFIDFQALTLSTGALHFLLKAPDESVLLGNGGISASGLDTGPILLTAAGLYALVVEGFGDTPTYQFQLWDVPPPDAAMLTLGDANDGAIESPGASDAWTFTAAGGQSVFIDFTALSDRATIQLDAPDGTMLLLDGGSFLDNGPITLPEDGVYSFMIRGSGDRTPTYQFTMWDVRPDDPVPISVGTPASPAPVSDLRRPGESLTFTFDAAAGDELALHVSRNAVDANVFTLVSPSGAKLLSDVSSDQLLDPLTEAGTYSLHVTLPPFQPPELHGAFTFEIVKLVAPTIGEADNRGAEFWLTIPQNVRDPFALQPIEVSVMLAATNDATAIITIPALDYIQFVDIPAGGLVAVLLPAAAELGGQIELTEDNGIRIIASDEVSVFGYSTQPFSSDGFLALPKDVLGTEYIVLGYQATVFSLPGTQLAVLATEHDTTVTITPADTIGSHDAGVPYELQLNRGQAYQLASVLDVGADVTGTIITSDKPIAVFGSNRCTVVPAGNFDACDYLVEQLPPVEAWGRRFVTMPLASRAGGDTFRMLAQQDGTEVTVNGTVVATLSRGQFHEQLIGGPAEITANLPILVAQYANSESFDGSPADPFMMLVPADEQFGNDFTLPALDDPGYDRHFVNVIVPGGAVGFVTIDGVAVPASDYVAIGSSGFFGAQIAVAVGSHRVSGPLAFGAYVYGFGHHDSYAFGGGVNLTPPVMVASLELHPQSISRFVGSRHTVTASVADQLNQPLAGIQVGFTVTGVNAAMGSAVTDSAGEAKLTFTGVNPGIDSIVAFVGTVFDTASVRWAASGPLLTIVSPADGSEFDAGSVQLVTGQVLPGDPSGAIAGVTINGQPVDALDGAGNFFALVTIAAGLNSFDVSAVDSNGIAANATLGLDGIAPSTEPAVDNLEDARNLGRFTFERTTFNRRTRTLHADMRLTNVGAESLTAGALAVFNPFGPPSVALMSDAANLPAPDGRAFVSLDMSMPSAGLAAGATSDALPLEFLNPRAARFDVQASLSVPGNAAPRFTSAPGALAVSSAPYTYDADAADADSNVLRYSIDTAPAGMTIDSETGAVNWVPAQSDLGLHNITVAVTDGYGGRARQSFALRVVEPPPGNRDPILVSTPVTTFNLAASPYVYQATALDSDAQPLNYSLANAPAGMTIDPLTGVVTWPLAASDVGRHDIELRVEDGQGGSDSQAFVVEIIDVVPAEVRGVTFEDSNANGVQDIGEPGLSGFKIFIDSNLNGRRDTGELSAVTDSDGNYSLSGVLPGTHRVAQQPRTGWDPTFPAAGTHSVTVNAGGSIGDIDFGNRTNGVTSTADPSFTTAPLTTAKVNTLYRYDPLAVDPDGDDLTFALVSGPAGMSVDAMSGGVRWRPSADQQVTHPVLLQVTDGQGGIAVQAFDLFVFAQFHSPVITSAPPLVGTAGETYTYGVMAFDPGTEPITYGLPVRPASMSIDPQTGELTWTPEAADLGTHRVEVRATNTSGLSAFQSFDLDIRPPNTSPRFTTEPVLESAAGELYRYDADAVDDDDGLSFSLVTAPAGMTINSVTGLLIWRSGPSDVGAHDATVRATDERGLSTDQSYKLTIGPDTVPPIVDIASPSVIHPGETILIQVTASDNVGVVSRTLEIDGVVVPLGAGGASFTATVPGLVDLVGSATDAAGNVGTTSLRLRVADPADTVPPEITITSPVPGSVVTYLTDVIGSITGTDVEFFRVDFARLDQVDLSDIAADVPGWATYPTPPEKWASFPWTFLAYGTTEVSNESLGLFDPTVLDNDSYAIRVVAQDFSGNINVQALTVSVEGSAKLGQFSLEFVELSLPLAGIPIQVTRRYSTLNADEQGDFGFGWSLAFAEADIRETLPLGLEQQLGVLHATPFRSDTRVYVTDPDGRRVGFAFAPEPSVSFIGTYFTPKFTADPGVYDRLEVDPVALSQRDDGSYGIFLLGAPYNPSSYRLVRADGTVYQYDQFEGLQSVTDRNGNRLRFTDAGIFHSSGESIQFVHDSLGRVTEITDPAGNSIRYDYDSRGDLKSVTNQTGLTTRFTYLADPAHYLDEIVDRLGRTTLRTEFDDEGRVVATIDALGHRQEQFFDPSNFIGSLTDAKGHVTTLVYNERGNVVEARNPLGGVRTFVYGDPRNPDLETAITDENGHTTSYTYDDRGNLLTQTDALGGLATYAFDTFGNVNRATDPLGRVTTGTYDANGNLLEVIRPDGGRLRFAYDTQGRVVSSTDALGNSTTFLYSGSASSPSEIVNPDGTSRTFEYNILGSSAGCCASNAKPTRITDEIGATTIATYDAAGVQTSQRNAMGNEVTFTEVVPIVVRVRDAAGRESTFEYNDAKHLVRQTDPMGGITSFTYDANGNRETVTDPVGNMTLFAYDALDRVATRTDPLGNVTTFHYDAVGNLTELVDRNGRSRRFVYDALNRIVEEQWYETGSLLRNSLATYDAVGNVRAISDPDSAYTFTYDTMNRLLTVDNIGTADVPHVVLTYAYDAGGNLLSVQDNLGSRAESAYNNRNRLTSRVWFGVGVDAARVDFAYNARGDRSSITRFSDLAGLQPVGRTAIEYDNLIRVTGITHRDAVDAVIAEYDYTYDLADQLLQEAHHGQTFDYSHDLAGQLLEAHSTAFGDELYSYDANGSRTSGGAKIGANNQIESDDQYRYEYDAEGNLIRKTEIANGNVTLYKYDHRNRLIRAEERSAGGILLHETEFTYDALDRRIAKTVNGQRVVTVYDGAIAWLDFDAAGTVLARYRFGPKTDEILARFRPSDGTAWYLADKLGTVRDIAGASGAVIAHADYSSFGRLLTVTDPLAMDRFAFTGREFDSETGLYYYRARYYDPTQGRFVNQDPIGFNAGDPNLYRYVFNNPLTLTDPSGLTEAIEYLAVLNVGLLVASVVVDLLAYVCEGVADFGTTLAFEGAGLTFGGILGGGVGGIVGIASGTAGAVVGAGIGASILGSYVLLYSASQRLNSCLDTIIAKTLIDFAPPPIIAPGT